MDGILKKIIWLIGCALVVFVASASAATGSFQPDGFYDAGQIDEIYPFLLQREWTGAMYQNPKDDYFTVSEDAASKIVAVANKKWKHIILDVSHLNTAVLTLELTALDENGNPVKTQRIEARGGKEIFPCELPKCESLLLGINGQKGASFRINELQFRKRLFEADKKKMAFAGMLAIIIYTGSSAVVIVLKRKKGIDVFLPLKKAEKKCFELYFTAVGRTADFLYRAIGACLQKTDERIRSAIRIIPLSAWILAEIFMRGNGLRGQFIWLHYVLAVFILLIFTVTSFDGPPRKQPWNNTLAYAWTWFSVIMILSDLFVRKKLPWIGLLFLTVYALWFWVWGSRKKPEQILADISYSLKIAFWITTVLSVFGRTYISGAPYSGIYRNQNVFVSFLVMVLAVDLAQACNLFLKDGAHAPRSFCLSVELCLVMFFLVSTQSRGGVLTGMILVFLCFLSLTRKKGTGAKRKLIFFLQTVLLFFPVSYTADLAILKVQEIFPERLIYQTEMLAAEDENPVLEEIKFSRDDIVYAAENKNHLWDFANMKSLDALTSGRVTLWKAYIRKLNLFGHYFRVKTNGLTIHSHNAFIHITFLYGILILIPYTVMWWSLFTRAGRYAGNGSYYRFLPLALLCGFFIQAMTDTLEEPFSMECWIIAYIVIGILFGKDAEKRGVRENGSRGRC